MELVIVESPTKARTLSRFLGSNYTIDASMGHIRDLPKSKLGVDVTHNFEPNYIIPLDKYKKVSEILSLAKKADFLWLATDPDREGEAIAWHLEQIITGKVPLTRSKAKAKKSKKTKKQSEKSEITKPAISENKIKRVEFHEITQSAIEEAFKHPRDINLQLVDAQQARRVLDRLVGYSLSPVLWKKVKKGLSAGRVQSVALRLLVEREKEIQAFTPVEYWSIQALLQNKAKVSFLSELIAKNSEKLEIKSETEAKALKEALEKASYSVSQIDTKKINRQPAAPFTTSTLQQAAGNKLGFSAKKTMMFAQNLYEQGFITYMRTDSVNLASQALDSAREYISQSFGASYLPATPRRYASKVKNAQEAHEAIRPTNLSLPASQVEGLKITRDHHRLYDLIWKRTIASQMAQAEIEQTSVTIKALNQNDNFDFRSNGSVIIFDGWLKLYNITTEKTKSEEPDEESSENQILPELTINESIALEKLLPEQHFTQPPPRYNDSSLVKKLEELGIGRPSTYAPTISTIQDRFYAERQERKLIPTVLGIAVSDFLAKNFPKIIDYDYTAEMEDVLDEISRGEKPWQAEIAKYYKPIQASVETAEEKAEHVKLELETVDKLCPTCGKQLVIRTGRFGKFLACSGFPECKYTENFSVKIDAICPEDGGEIVARKTKKGRVFYGCKNYPNCKYATWTKPKSNSPSAT